MATAPRPTAQGSTAGSFRVAKARREKSELRLRLYIAGQAPNSLRAIANAKAVCNEHFPADYVLEIVDLMEEPLRALADAIIVTPTLIRLSPLPARRVIGSLNDADQLLLALSSK